jgi:hypothetical protein
MIANVKSYLAVFAAASTGILVSCATSTEVYDSNGNQAHLIEGGGEALTMTVCYKKAAQICPAGYRVVDADQFAGPPSLSANQFGVYSSSQIYRSIVVSCS